MKAWELLAKLYRIRMLTLHNPDGTQEEEIQSIDNSEKEILHSLNTAINDQSWEKASSAAEHLTNLITHRPELAKRVIFNFDAISKRSWFIWTQKSILKYKDQEIETPLKCRYIDLNWRDGSQEAQYAARGRKAYAAASLDIQFSNGDWVTIARATDRGCNNAGIGSGCYLNDEKILVVKLYEEAPTEETTKESEGDINGVI